MTTLEQRFHHLRTGENTLTNYNHLGLLELLDAINLGKKTLEIIHCLPLDRVIETLQAELGFELNPELIAMMSRDTLSWTFVADTINGANNHEDGPNLTLLFWGNLPQTEHTQTEADPSLSTAVATMVVQRYAYNGPIEIMDFSFAGKVQSMPDQQLHVLGGLCSPSGHLCALDLTASETYFPQITHAIFKQELYGGRDDLLRPAGLFTEGMIIPVDRLIRLTLNSKPTIVNQYYVNPTAENPKGNPVVRADLLDSPAGERIRIEIPPRINDKVQGWAFETSRSVRAPEIPTNNHKGFWQKLKIRR
ncbi:hypothetical protein A3C98_04250 [Candidatus Roizmanbacteria bacterium RIFCSPHIGHO2_02_FULL_37_15]|uniref:Uncharacterized protein n=1 Tax=Candidatus Roizmanbacteria bacterium RIFCSPLOWO2_01_FULL_37_16 TaxID=1802058 RepID=A0A1F7IP50_9BACT|nr:MAG: hypothetical protein A2859_00700 [Candidatus Roizmanbacteria bacterium RIFCSPHIGHO2_01_FULL_37_16b]OGK22608.1 MAG: hypothetical protein A3C98_04250 [Candidatus Roizmanbacteria bacterium RIFCSPHIGHO2_02_FULL_37_15]OGK45156.1 MAG: hypothetical protein A3B40_01985 [Candidatus Roizmanbacteria bacterium RIFCSPLOWO2_01_FULL_37_16]